jgi:ABC-type Zn uptake system ZnuABC Zn-binding protein ZnuA
MYDFAKKIGGDKVEVINLVPAGTEPHDWEPSTKDLIEMEKSDIFIYNGAGMEQWVDDVLESLDTEELTSVEASKGIKLLKDQDAHEHDHEHNSENDPHVWLDPQNAKYEMNKIKKALIKVDAENKDYTGVTLVDVDDFEDYCEELMEEFGYINKDTPQLIKNNIDYKGIAEDMKYDYTEVTYQGNRYLGRV